MRSPTPFPTVRVPRWSGNSARSGGPGCAREGDDGSEGDGGSEDEDWEAR